MWMNSGGAWWEVEYEAQERIEAAYREAEMRRLAALSRDRGTVQVHSRLLAAAQAVLQRLVGHTYAGAQPAQT